jgi:hypothetical protein
MDWGKYQKETHAGVGHADDQWLQSLCRGGLAAESSQN